MLHNAWLIALAPSIAFIVILFFGKRLPQRGAEVGIGAMTTMLALSLWLAVDWVTSDRQQVVSQHRWFDVGDWVIRVGTLTDGLTVMMLVVVSLISLLVQIFSAEYMRADRRFTHFFAILTLFSAAMSSFVMSANTIQMAVGWEVMALCSFLLIGHWWEEPHNVRGAAKALLTTRLSDVGLFIGIVVLFFAGNKTFSIVDINSAATAGTISSGLLLAGATALFVAAIGKSAQFPLHTWLPDAMAGPTPMSALIHAATMVVAGVYLLARLFPVFDGAFDILPGGGTNPIAVIGAITIVISALLAFVQHDVKKVLSYSTVSQLGYMVMAIGVGAWTAAMFHLFAHAFFKALLFLGAGSVSHSVHGFDIEKDMGGLRKTMPTTHLTFAIGSAALVGVIPLCGFWSKEQIVATAGQNGYTFFQLVAILGTLLTAGYITRCYYKMFWGEHRGSSTPHESPKLITVPLVILAVLTVISGFLEAPVLGIHLFSDWVTPSYAPAVHHESGIGWPFLVEIVVALVGIFVTWKACEKRVGMRTLSERSAVLAGFNRLLINRYYLDALYEQVIVRNVIRLGIHVDRYVDRAAIDGVVNASAAAAKTSGAAAVAAQSGRVQTYANAMFTVTVLVALILVVAQ